MDQWLKTLAWQVQTPYTEVILTALLLGTQRKWILEEGSFRTSVRQSWPPCCPGTQKGEYNNMTLHREKLLKIQTFHTKKQAIKIKHMSSKDLGWQINIQKSVVCHYLHLPFKNNPLYSL